MSNGERLADPTSFPDKRLIGVGDRIDAYDGGLDALLNPPPADIPTGFPTLDLLMNGGLRNGELMYIGARTSVGKSAFISQLALNAARQGKTVGYFSLEMAFPQIFRRMVCSLAGVALPRLLRKELQEDDLQKLARATEELRDMPLKIDDRSDLSAKTLRAVYKATKPDLVVIDYLQLMASSDSRSLEVSNISRNLHLLSKDDQVPVVALCQLNRQAEDKEVPQLSHLRESGSLEQDAQIVALMFRAPDEEKLSTDGDYTSIYMNLPKNRDGILGLAHFRFYGARMLFVDTPPQAADLTFKAETAEEDIKF